MAHLNPNTQITTLALQQYTKDIPPGWRPRSYPIREYCDYLRVWHKLTKLDEEQIGAAITSRLYGAAWNVAMKLSITRNDGNGNDVEHVGIDAVSLLESQPIYNQVNGQMLAPGYISGIRTLMEKLLDSFGLDDQDQAWVALDKFFSYSRSHNTDFNSYLLEWERLFDEACRFGGLQINDICKTFMFFSRSGLNDKQLADLRLKVNGDLTRFNDMVRLQNKITKNELASQDQQQGYRGYGYQSNHHDDDHTDYYDGWEYPDDDSWYWDDYYGDWFYDDGTDYYATTYEDDSWDYDGDPNWEEEYDYNNNAEPTDENSEQYKGSKGKGKGKGKGKKPEGDQCTKCGSKYHNSDHCPLNEGSKSGKGKGDSNYSDNNTDLDDYYGGKGKGKGKRRKGKGKGRYHFGKGKGGFGSSSSRFPRPPSYGKGKGKGGKGKGKGKGKHWSGFALDDSFHNFMQNSDEQVDQSSTDVMLPAPSRGYVASPSDDSASHTFRGTRTALFGPSHFGSPQPLAAPSSSNNESKASFYDNLPKGSTTVNKNQKCINCRHCTGLAEFRCPVCGDSICTQHYDVNKCLPCARLATAPATEARLNRVLAGHLYCNVQYQPDTSDSRNCPLCKHYSWRCDYCNELACANCSNLHYDGERYTCTACYHDRGTAATSSTTPATASLHKPEDNSDDKYCPRCNEQSWFDCDYCSALCCSNCKDLHYDGQHHACTACYNRNTAATAPTAEQHEEPTGNDDLNDSWEQLPTNDAVNFFTTEVDNLKEFDHSVFLGNNNVKAYTSVRGAEQYGLLVDPGAARGLIGSDTLNDIVHGVLKPLKLQHQVKWSSSAAKFSGISPDTQHSLGLVSIPIGLLGIKKSTYSADVIGKGSSKCPGLIPLRTLLANGCLLACGYFSNGDGILAIRTSNSDKGIRYAAQRLLLTDSGHYLLPVNNFWKGGNSNWDRQAEKAMSLLHRSSQMNNLNQYDTSLSLVVFDNNDEDEKDPPEPELGFQ